MTTATPPPLTRDPLTVFDDFLLLSIFERLDPEDVVAASRVSSGWRSFLRHSGRSLFRPLYESLCDPGERLRAAPRSRALKRAGGTGEDWFKLYVDHLRLQSRWRTGRFTEKWIPLDALGNKKESTVVGVDEVTQKLITTDYIAERDSLELRYAPRDKTEQVTYVRGVGPTLFADGDVYILQEAFETLGVVAPAAKACAERPGWVKLGHEDTKTVGDLHVTGLDSGKPTLVSVCRTRLGESEVFTLRAFNTDQTFETYTTPKTDSPFHVTVTQGFFLLRKKTGLEVFSRTTQQRIMCLDRAWPPNELYRTLLCPQASYSITHRTQSLQADRTTGSRLTISGHRGSAFPVGFSAAGTGAIKIAGPHLLLCGNPTNLVVITNFSSVFRAAEALRDETARLRLVAAYAVSLEFGGFGQTAVIAHRHRLAVETGNHLIIINSLPVGPFPPTTGDVDALPPLPPLDVLLLGRLVNGPGDTESWEHSGFDAHRIYTLPLLHQLPKALREQKQPFLQVISFEDEDAPVGVDSSLAAGAAAGDESLWAKQ